MKAPAFEYHRPATVEEALAVLAEVGHDGKVLAGGQSLVPLLNMRLAATVRREVMRSKKAHREKPQAGSRRPSKEILGVRILHPSTT
jgi:CO/xanthine dehydrogenase FAD-binding subunit